jgi:CoA:oxalate CoA-transferase
MSEKPLSGIRVIDMTRILSGPYCTMILRHLGAEVIKIERPGTGDEARLIGPFLGDDLKKSAYFMSINAGKKSVVVDLKSVGGKKIMEGLIQKSDVLVENYRPGTLARLGFPEQQIKKINPAIIYTSVSGFGRTGPESQKGAFDMIIQGLSGIISITGTEDGRTVRVGTSISDIIAGTFAAVAVVSSLYRREVKGIGASIDIAMLDSTVAILENAIARFTATKTVPRPLGTRHPSITPFGIFRTKDAEIIIAAGHDRLFTTLCELLGRPELATDKRFETNEQRNQNVAELTRIIESILSSHSTQWWLEKLDEAGIPCAKIHDISDLFSYEQIRERNMLLPVAGEKEFTIAGNPIKVGGIPDETVGESAPALGEHTDEVMRDVLGYSDEEITRLCEDGILSKGE